MYWAMSTMSTVGYGDISAETDMERIFSILWMIYGIGFFSVVIGSIESFLASNDVKEQELKEKMDVIEDFCKEANIESDLRLRLKYALQYSTERTGFTWFDKQHILKELPKQLRYEMAMSMFQGAVKEIPFF